MNKALLPLDAAAALAAGAGTHATADSGFHDRPASPRSLPANNLPPFGMLDDDGKLVPEPALPPGGINRGAGTPPESTARGPKLALAIADGSHVFVAMRKALTALAFQMPSSTAQQRVPQDAALLARVTPNMFVAGGGLPIGHQDEVCAAARPRRTGLLEMHERLRPAQQVALRVVDAE